jgi:anti-anti-sigma factor
VDLRPFTIADVPAGTATVVDVTGEVDMGTGPAFHTGLLQALGAGRNGLIVDLSRVSFLDSAALTSLVNAFDSLREQGGSLIIVATDPRMRAFFSVARLDRDFLVLSSRADALAAVGA